jgi:hypothetical protein
MWALILSACDPLCRTRGQLSNVVAGVPEAPCVVRLHYTVGEEESRGAPCRQQGGSPGEGQASFVTHGQPFECHSLPGVEPFDVTVACQGYETYRSSPFHLRTKFLLCEGHDLGTITPTIVGSQSPSADAKPD